MSREGSEIPRPETTYCTVRVAIVHPRLSIANAIGGHECVYIYYVICNILVVFFLLSLNDFPYITSIKSIKISNSRIKAKLEDCKKELHSLLSGLGDLLVQSSSLNSSSLNRLCVDAAIRRLASTHKHFLVFTLVRDSIFLHSFIVKFLSYQKRK